MQFAPPSSGEEGSAKSRPVDFGALRVGTWAARPRTAAISPACSAGSATGCADRCCAGSHIGMTCTVGCAGSGAAGWMSCGGRGDAGLARNPSGQTSARTLRGAGRGRSSTGLGPLRRTWTTSTTLLLPPAAPLLRRALSTRRCSLCEDWAPSSFRRGKTRSASDMTFHEDARSPQRRWLRRCARGRIGTKCGPRLLTRSRATDWRPARVGNAVVLSKFERGRRRACEAGLGVGGTAGLAAVPMARPVRR